MIRIRYKKLGGHIHCRMFTGKGDPYTWAKVGDLTFDEREWIDEIHNRLSHIAQLVEEDE